MSTPIMIPLPHVSRRVADATKQPGPPPRKIYELTLRGAFPAEFINGRWFVAECDLPKVVEALGLSVPAQQKQARSRAAVAA